MRERSESRTKVAKFVIFVCFLVIAPLIYHLTPVYALSNQDCYSCHGSKDILQMSKADLRQMVIPVRGVKKVSPGVTSLYVDPTKYKASVHGSLGCTDCHTDITQVPHKQYLAPVDCSMCHPDVAAQYKKSRHFKISNEPCWACHDPHTEVPIKQLSQNQRISICLRCHAGTPHDWLPQPQTHFKYLECTVCHSPKATKGMFLHFYVVKDGKRVPVTYSELAKALDTKNPNLFEVIDANRNGKLDPREIRVVLDDLKGAGISYCGLQEEILVTKPYHNFTDQVKNIKDCAMCHTSVSPFYKTIQVEIPEKNGGYKLYPVNRQYLAKMPPIPNQHAYLNSVHAKNGVTCLNCHSEFKVFKKGGKIVVKSPGVVVCANCHPGVMEQYKKSLHYRVSKKICYNCHDPHAVVPFDQLTAAQRRAICEKCHTDALEKHSWLPQADIHFKYLECTMCHSPGAKKGIVYFFQGVTLNGKTVYLGYQELAKILGKSKVDISKYIEKNSNGKVSAFELASFLKVLNSHRSKLAEMDLKAVCMGVRLVVLKPVHNFTDKGLKAKDCTICHSANAPFYSKVLLEIPEANGGIQTLPLDRTVLTGAHGIVGTSDFYLLGEHRLTKQDLEQLWYTIKSIGYRWLDILGILILLGGFAFAGLHTFFRILTIGNRSKHIK